MADPLSATASVVSIALPALHGMRLLLDDIQKIVDAPKAVATLKEDLRSVDTVLEALKVVDSSEWESLGQEVVDGSEFAISTCAKACDTFRNDLKSWTKHSKNGNLSWRDRANVGFLKQQRMKSLCEQLQNCKIVIGTTVSVATLHSSLRHTHITEEIKRTISTKETEIAEAIVATDKQMVETGNRLQQLSIADPAQEDQSGNDRVETLRDITQERAALEASRKVLGELLSKTQERTGITITNVRISKGGQVLSGLINTQGKYSDSTITIDNVEATTGGKGVVGIVEGVDLDNFFK